MLSSNATNKRGVSKIGFRILFSNVTDDDRPCKIPRTNYLPADCLTHIFYRLDTRDDRNSFGLTCHEWLQVQNNNQKSLWYGRKLDEYPETSPERFPSEDVRTIRNPYGNGILKISQERIPMLLCKLLIRFHNIKHLNLSHLPKITGFVAPKPPVYESKVQYLYLNNCNANSDAVWSSMFPWFPRLTCISFRASHITDKGLEVVAKYCLLLETIILSRSHLITDSGIRFLLHNCGCKLTPEGIKAIVSGGGLEYLSLSALFESAKDGEGSINTKAVVMISKGCPLLKKLDLTNCNEVELQGWEAIGQNCKNLERLTAYGCRKLCDRGLQALCQGCNKLSGLFIDNKNMCSRSALELFERKDRNVLYLLNKDNIRR
ncbi:hypothetical protein MKW94_012832 [Papaver nudicaule]|uniref:F-box domain-containing protein n=1 Tax=Papaver nudicaule TaxID=74823 RepID=A0AA41V9C5_PAPNU|nr:hypothetical protein [Papaver nudicaule]